MSLLLIALGIIFGIIAAAFAYWKTRKIYLALLWLVLVFLAIGTFLHCIILPVIAGIYFNKWLYKHLKKNWLAFLVSLLGLVLIALLLAQTGKLYVPMKVEGSAGIGGALAKGIGLALLYLLFIIAGLASYAVAIIFIFVYRVVKKR